MEQLLFVLTSERLTVYENIGEREFKIFRIKGEEYIQVDIETCEGTIKMVTANILEKLNYDNFAEVECTVVYDPFSASMLKALSYAVLPCARWEVYTVDTILPVVLSNTYLTQKESFIVECLGVAWEATVEEDGKVNVQRTKEVSEEIITPIQLLQNFYGKYYIDTSGEKVEELQKQLYEKEKLISLLEQSLDESQKMLNKSEEKTKQIQSLADALQKKASNEQEQRKQAIFSQSRQIVRARVPQISVSARGGFFASLQKNHQPVLNWVKNDKETVYVQHLLAKVGMEGSSRQEVITAKSSGCLFKIVKRQNAIVSKNQVIAVISDPADTIEDIKQWLRDKGERI